MWPLRKLFFPDTLKNRPLFSQERVALYIEEDLIQVARITAKRNTTVIRSLDEYHLNPGDARTYHQRLVSTLKKVGPKIPKDAEIIVTFPSAKVVLKELTLPFLDEEKIRMVVEYEVESAIPFKLENALIDFVILKQSMVKESSTILVAAAQKEDVRKLIDALQKADIQAHQLTLDMFTTTSLFASIPQYNKLKHAYVIADVRKHATSLVLVDNQAIIASRTILKGAADAAAGQQEKLFEEITFTLNSFEMKQASLAVEKLFFNGPREVYEAFEKYVQKNHHFPCEQLAADQIQTSPAIQSSLSLPPAAWLGYSRALGAALLCEPYDTFTLRRKELEVSPKPLIEKQSMAAFLLLFILLTLFAAQAYQQHVTASNAIKALETKELKRLKSALPTDAPGMKKKNVKAVAKDVEAYIAEQEELWAAFSEQRLRPLEVLQELSLLFNKKKFDLDIEMVTVSALENEAPIEVRGTFRSKTNPGKEDFRHFTELARDLRSSKTLMLTEEVDPTQLAEGKGVTFSARFKVREEAL